VIKTIMSVVYP